jgi:hypothetical protein
MILRILRAQYLGLLTPFHTRDGRVLLGLNFEEAESRAQDYVKKRLDSIAVETLSVRYDKKSEEFVIAFKVTDKQGAKRQVRVRYDKDGTMTGYELKQEKRDRY